jgi:hypothetical protein
MSPSTRGAAKRKNTKRVLPTNSSRRPTRNETVQDASPTDRASVHTRSPNDPGRLLLPRSRAITTDKDEGEQDSDDERVTLRNLTHAKEKIAELERIVTEKDEYIVKLIGHRDEMKEELEHLRWMAESSGDNTGKTTTKKNVRRSGDWTEQENALRSDVAHIVRTELCPNIKFLPEGWDRWTSAPKTICLLFQRKMSLGDGEGGKKAWREVVTPFVKTKMSDYRQYVNKSMKEVWSK